MATRAPCNRKGGSGIMLSKGRRMNTKVLSAGAAIVALLACSTAGAQMRGAGSSGASMPARAVPVRVTTMARAPAASTSGVRSMRQPTVIQIAPSGRVISNPGSFAESANFGDENAVPGLGFDYANLAAVSGNFRNNPPDFGRGGRHQHDFVTPIFFGGFPYYSDSVDYPQVQQQPQIIVI